MSHCIRLDNTNISRAPKLPVGLLQGSGEGSRDLPEKAMPARLGGVEGRWE